MSNSKIFINELFTILWLCLFQVIILNQIDFLGYINPYFYVVYVIGYGLDKNKTLLLFMSFILGWIIDCFMNTSGMHAFSITLIAYLRLPIFRWVAGAGTSNLEKSNLFLYDLIFLKKLSYIFLLVFIHHSSLYLLDEIHIIDIPSFFIRVLNGTIFTSFLSLIYFFLKNRKF